LREFDLETFELLSSFNQWVQKHFGSVKLAFTALQRESKDAKDTNGELSYLELKKAAQRLHWDGDMRAIFTAVAVDSKTPVDGKGKKGAKKGPKLAISYKDLAFLDSWLPQVHDEESSTVIRKSPTSPQSRKSLKQITSVPALHDVSDPRACLSQTMSAGFGQLEGHHGVSKRMLFSKKKTSYTKDLNDLVDPLELTDEREAMPQLSQTSGAWLTGSPSDPLLETSLGRWQKKNPADAHMPRSVHF